MKIDYRIEQEILDLRSKGFYVREIAKELKLSIRSINNVLKKYRCPKEEKIANNHIKKITDIIDLRLLFFCEDIELLRTMFDDEFQRQQPEKIIVPNRIKKIEKINNKCVQILEKIRV